MKTYNLQNVVSLIIPTKDVINLHQTNLENKMCNKVHLFYIIYKPETVKDKNKQSHQYYDHQIIIGFNYYDSSKIFTVAIIQNKQLSELSLSLNTRHLM